MLLPFILPMPSSPQFLAAKVRVTAGAYAAMVSEEKIARKVKIKAAFLLCMNKQIFFLRLHRFRQRLVRCGGRGKGIISLFLHYFSLTTCADPAPVSCHQNTGSWRGANLAILELDSGKEIAVKPSEIKILEE